jgi:hypothetical protein
MAIDSSIYFQQQGPDLVGSLQKGLSMREMIDNRKKAQEEEDRQKLLSQAYQAGVVTNPDGSVGFDQNKVLSQLAKTPGAGKQVFEAQGMFQKENAEKAKLEAEKLKAGAEKLNQFTNYIGNANATLKKDPGQYQYFLSDAKSRGYDVSGLPPQYDQDAQKKLDFYEGQALSYKDKLDQQLKQLHSENEAGSLANAKQKTAAEIEKIQAEVAKTKAETGVKGGMTEGQKALDKDYAKDYNDWTSTGKAALDKNLQRLQDAKQMLQSDPTLTGSVRGMLPDFIRNSTNETAIRVRDQVRAAAQGALKATLGSAFTEKEGERIMNQAYNEKLSPEENIRKIDAAIQELVTNKSNNDTKADLFGRTGSISKLAQEPEKTIAYNQNPNVKVINGQTYRKVEGGWLPAQK